MLARWVLRRPLRGSNSKVISTRTRQLSPNPYSNTPSHGINGLHSITRKRQSIAQNARLNIIKSRSLMTEAIPSIAVPPLMFIGLLLGLWTWKCFWIIVMQNKLLYLSWLPPFTRSETISDYRAECRPVQWEEKQIRSLDGTKLAVCEGHIPILAKDNMSSLNNSAPQNKDQAKLIPKQKKSVVICYFQGNGGSTPMRLPLLSHVLRAITETSRSTSPSMPGPDVSQYTIAALSYRGYWTSSGRATQSGIEMDAQAFLNWASETYASPETDVEVVIWGHSLGAAVASSAVSTYLARQHEGQTSSSNRPLAPISRLILEAPTSSIKDMLISLYPQKWLPYRYLWPFSWNNWDIKAKMQEMATWRDEPGSQSPNEATPPIPRSLPPIFLISGDKDEVVPPYVPDQLEQHARSLGLEIQRKDVLGAMHIEAPLKLDGRKAMVQFILNGTSVPKT